MSLPLFDPPSRAPKVSEWDVQMFVATLRGLGWMTAKQLAAFASERKLRALAEASNGEVIGGQRGYRLTEEATSGEINHCIAFLKSQAEKMHTRAKQIEMARHRCKETAA